MANKHTTGALLDLFLLGKVNLHIEASWENLGSVVSHTLLFWRLNVSKIEKRVLFGQKLGIIYPTHRCGRHVPRPSPQELLNKVKGNMSAPLYVNSSTHSKTSRVVN